MNNLNSILIEGNLVKDPLYRTTPRGTPVCSFTLASNRFSKKDSGMEKEVGFFDVETWAKLAENCYNKGHKGRGVRVVGRLKQDRWNDAEGNYHSRITIVAEHVEFKPEFKKEGSPAGVSADAESLTTSGALGMADMALAGEGGAAFTPATVSEYAPAAEMEMEPAVF